MAGAQTSIALQDKLTGPLMKMMKALDSTIKVMEKLDSTTQQLDQKSLANARKNISNASADLERLRSSMNSSGKGADTAARQQEKFNNSLGDGLSKVKSYAAGLLAAVGAYKAFNATKSFLGDMFSQGIELSAFKQTSKEAFTIFLGDAEKAQQYMDDMYAFALKTPFAYPDLLESTRNLIAFGVEADNTFSIMKAIGDTVAMDINPNVSMANMADIFGMIQVSGRITTMEVRRLAKHGVNAYEMLGDAAGVTGEVMKEKISKGTVGAGFAIKALVEGIEKSSGGLMEKVKGTWLGSVDSLKSSVRNAGEKMMKSFMVAEGPLVTLVQNITGIIKKIPDYIGPAVAAFLPLVNVLNKTLETGAFNQFFTVVGGGMTALAWIISGLGMAVLKVAQFFNNHWSVIRAILIPIGAALALITGILIAKYAWLGLVRMATLAMAAASRVWAAAQWAVNAAYLANPIGITLLILVGIVALVIYVMIQWAEQTAVVVGAIVGSLYWLGAAFYNVLMGIGNLIIIVVEFFVNTWNLGIYAVQMGFIGFNTTVWLVLDAIANAALAVAEWFVNTWNMALYLAQLGWIAFNIGARMVLDAIGNAALAVAEWFANTWNSAVYGVQMAFYKMGTFVGTIMSGVASGVVGVVNSALGAVSTLINSAVGGINSLIGMINNIPGVNISTVGTVDLKLGAGVTNFAANIGKNLVAPTKAANVSLGRMNTAGDYAKNVTMPTAPGKANLGIVNNAERYVNNVKEPSAPVKKSYDRLEYTSLGDAYAEGNAAGKNFSLKASDKLTGALDKVSGLLGKGGDNKPFGDDIPNGDLSAGAVDPLGGGKDKSGGGKGGKGSNPTGGKLDSVGKIDDEISIADEDLKMLKELADIRSIQNFRTLNPTVNFTGDMTIREESDIKKIIKGIEEYMQSEMDRSTEGVYT